MSEKHPYKLEIYVDPQLVHSDELTVQSNLTFSLGKLKSLLAEGFMGSSPSIRTESTKIVNENGLPLVGTISFSMNRELPKDQIESYEHDYREYLALLNKTKASAFHVAIVHELTAMPAAV